MKVIFNYLREKIFYEKLNNIVGFIFLLLISIFLTYAMVYLKYSMGAIVLLGLIGIGITLLILFNIEFGFAVLFIFSFFISYLFIIISEDLPSGSVIELLLILLLIGIVIKYQNNRWQFLQSINHPITMAYMIFLGYMVIQAFNPNMHSTEGWVFAFRKITGFFALFVIMLAMLRDVKTLRKFIYLWLGLSFIAAVYGCHQEWFGLLPVEERYIRSDPQRFQLTFVAGRFRVFSFLPGPTAFGMFMAESAIACIVLIIMKGASIRKKFVLAIIATFCAMAASYSGTRTAIAMIPIGLIVYILLTINNKNTLFIIASLVLAFFFVMYAPIYGNATINRIRSTFQPEEDASYQVREENRARIQPYIHDHPIGGGISTTGVLGKMYNPNHFLSSFPPDSAYVKTALETGWIGLIIQFTLIFIIMRTGIKDYFKETNQRKKKYFVVFLSVYFSIVIAMFTQQSVNAQYPLSISYFICLAVMAKLRRIPLDERKEAESNLQDNTKTTI